MARPTIHRAAVLNSIVATVAPWVPRPVLRAMQRVAVGEQRVAVVLHRVTDLPTSLLPGLREQPDRIDEFLDLADPIVERLEMHFDDGYADAVSYIDSRAAQHPEVGWVIAASADKTASRRGFAWDAFEAVQPDGDNEQMMDAWRAQVDGDVPDDKSMAGLADDDRYRLATAGELLAIAERHPNVRIANHTNRHLPMAWLDADGVEHEISASASDYDALFTPDDARQVELVLPFGCPPFVEPAQLDQIAEMWDGPVWTIQSRPYGDGQVRSRFSWMSDEYTPREFLLRLVVVCGIVRARGVVGRLIQRASSSRARPSS